MSAVLVLLLKGFAIGLAIAAPAGPVTVICVRRTLADGPGAGVACGLGAVAGDVWIGALAAFGVAAISELLLAHETALRAAGGVFLLWIGWRLLRAPAPDARGGDGRGRVGLFLAAAALTGANPLTILGFTAVFASFGVVDRALSAADAAVLLAGIAVGAATWWGSLVAAVATFRDRLGDGRMEIVNRVSGWLMVTFGVGALASLLVAW